MPAGPGTRDIRLLEVSETIAPQPPMPFMRQARAEAADAVDPGRSPGMVQAGVTVRVTYEMTR